MIMTIITIIIIIIIVIITIIVMEAIDIAFCHILGCCDGPALCACLPASRSRNIYLSIYLSLSIYINKYMYIYIYIYIAREQVPAGCGQDMRDRCNVRNFMYRL